MIAALVVQACPMLLVIAATCLAPSLGDSTLTFGVRIPAARRSAPVILHQLRIYRITVLSAGAVLLIAGVTVAALTAWPVLIGAVFLQLAVAAFGYTRAGAAIRAVKKEESWLTGLRQGVSVDTALRTEPERFPWAWVTPAVIVLAATVITGMVRYPHLPDPLALHYDVSGSVDRYANKSVWSAFGLVFLQALLTAGLIAMTYATFHARADLDPEDPATSSRAHRDSQTLMAKALLILAACANVSILLAALLVWSAPPAPWAGLSAAAALPVVIGVGVIIGVMTQHRRRVAAALADAPGANTGLTHRDDDRRSSRLFYADRNDPAVLVPKRFGVGYTLNFGRPASWLILAALVAVPTLLALFSR